MTEIIKEKIKHGKQNYFMRLLLAFGFLAALLITIFVVLFNVSKQNVLSIGQLNSAQMAQNIEYYLIEEIDEIALAAQTVEVMQDMGKTNAEISDYLTFESRIVNETISENYTGLYGYINDEYMDGSGWVPEPGYEPKKRPWYTGAIAGKGKVVYVTPYVDSETGTIMMSICKMLPDRKSVVSLDVSLDRIQEIVESDYFVNYDQVIVTDKNNIVVAALDESILGADISNDPMIREYRKGAGVENGYCVYRDNSGKRYVVFSSAVEDQWNVFLVKKNSSLMSSLYRIYAILAAGTIAFVVFVSQIFEYINRRRKAAESLNIQLESIADIYVSVHKLDLESDTIEEVRCLPFVREQKRLAEKNAPDSYEVLRTIMKALVRDEYWEDMKAFLERETLDVRVGNSNTIAIEVLGIHGWIKARIVVLKRINDRIASFLWLVENIDEEKRKQNELRYLSETDLMTGIRNRGSGEHLIKDALENNNGGMFCLMDADSFKTINDSYGHDVGDMVIKIIADCLKGSFAAGDIVMRLGGDEFAAFAAGIQDEQQAQGVLKRFVDAIGNADVPAFKGERKIEMSIGVSFVPPGSAKNFEELYREADKAVYQSKKTAGSCITFAGGDLT